jgi:hypothetical protein
MDNTTMNDIISNVLDSPYKAVAVSLSVASLGYLTIKGVHSFLSKGQMTHSFPPGPPRDPLIGAIRSFPKDHFYERVAEWAELYGAPLFSISNEISLLLLFIGDIVYAPIPGLNMITLNSYEVAQELLSKRPNTTAGRRVTYLITDLYVYTSSCIHWHNVSPYLSSPKCAFESTLYIEPSYGDTEILYIA